MGLKLTNWKVLKVLLVAIPKKKKIVWHKLILTVNLRQSAMSEAN